MVSSALQLSLRAVRQWQLRHPHPIRRIEPKIDIFTYALTQALAHRTHIPRDLQFVTNSYADAFCRAGRDFKHVLC